MKVITCLNEEVRGLMKEVLRAFDATGALGQQLDTMPLCEDGVAVHFSDKSSGAQPSGKKRSAWQEFASQCLKKAHAEGRGASAMKDCAAEWHEKKKVEKNG